MPIVTLHPGQVKLLKPQGLDVDIQFGEVKEAEPNRELRPDQDAQYAVFPVGDLADVHASESQAADNDTEGAGFHIDDDGDAFNNPTESSTSSQRTLPDDELRIYVDLDVFRAMETHAASNTKVELGGVMLGYQRLDEEGRPFVVVTECLQAEHYEASKTNFKFTHDTWSKITDDRAHFHPDLEMVGWYHTHPGFGIFLSGMDLFICNNFFSRNLDVALVIDPINHERGWFQWTQKGQRKQTRETLGFYLMTNRFRRDELQFFANVYSGGQAMNFDPRFSNFPSAGGQPVINIAESKRPVFDLAILAMLLMQFLFLALISWKLMFPGTTVEQATLDDEIRKQVYGEVLDSIVSKQTGKKGLVEKLKTETLENTKLKSNLEGQILLSTVLQKDVDKKDKAMEKQARSVEKLKSKNEALETDKKILTEQVKKLGGEPETGIDITKYLMWTLIGLVAGGLVGSIGYFFGARRSDLYEEYSRAAHESNARPTMNPETRKPAHPISEENAPRTPPEERLTLGDHEDAGSEDR